MDFTLTQEQVRFQEMMRKFAETEIAPGAVERDWAEDFTPAYNILTQKMGPMGLLGLTLPTQYGGKGKSYVDLALGLVEVCERDLSLGSAWSVCLSLGTIPLLHYGTEEQKQTFLTPCAQGKMIPAFALTEENAGSDAAMQETTAVLDGESYILNGRKIYITNAGFAGIYIVMAMTDRTKGSKGISAFVVSKDTPGLSFGKQYEKCGIRSTVQRELIFENCRVPRKNILGKEGEGFKIALNAIEVGRVCVAAQGVACAKAAYKKAMQRARGRCQFRKPIAENQIISFKLAEMATKIELAELLMFKAAWSLSAGLPVTKYAVMAKKFCTNTAQEVATDAIQIMGGAGYLRENEVERIYRDSKILQIYEGTNQIQDVVLSGILLKEPI